MSFWQRQQIQAAMRFLRWRYEKMQRPVPEADELERQAQNLVSEARRIARRTGRNVIGIVKDLVNDLKK